MATLKPILKAKKEIKKAERLIYIVYRNGYETPTFFSTEISVKPEHWVFDAKKKEYRIDTTVDVKNIVANKELIKTLETKDQAANAKLRNQLAKYENIKIRFEFDNNRSPTVKEFRNLIEPKPEAPKDPEPKKKTIISLYDEFLETEVDVRATTEKHFKVTKSHLESFLENIKKAKASQEILTYDFIVNFNQYLIKNKSQSPGTANNHIKRIKRFATWVVEGGKKTTKDVSLNKDRADKSKKIFLEADELDKLYKYDLSDNPRLEKVRDLFVLSCCTGLRYSDAQRITKDHIKKDLITITHLKNDKTTEIPVFLFAKDLIEKYNGDFPKITNQKMNDYLKELLELVEIDEPIIIPVWRGKEREDDKVFKKYELISTHHAKKTFCMLCVDNNMPIETLASITGNDEKTLKHYYEIRPEKKRKHLLEIEQTFKNLKVS